MKRKILRDLRDWKARPGHKPLILLGARQVGKTWAMQEFGRTSYADALYINFDNNPEMEDLFSRDLQIPRILAGLEVYGGRKIRPGETLLIFDEIQEIPRALGSLKYFNENAGEYDIVAAGSLMGIALHHGASFPVGKVEFLRLYPLSFAEFVTAAGDEGILEPLEKNDFALARVFGGRYTDLLKSYYLVGGMPEAVKTFAEEKDYGAVCPVQERILAAYEQDYSKHAPASQAPKIRKLWNSLPAQLSRENKKFMYGIVKQGGRAAEYELALLWLADCGLAHQIHRVSAPRLPLKAYQDMQAFKLFCVDVGLLSRMAGLRPHIMLEGARLFKEFKGALTEQFVVQELISRGDMDVFYWSSDKGIAEIDFILSGKYASLPGWYIPVEVKAEINLQAKSLKSFRRKFSPELSLRLSLSDYHESGGLIDLPLYAIGFWNGNKQEIPPAD
ncbi:MAG: ATP-binding protein [Treponema sp.]|jgi:predicted AAA+ superfamily ATPase|nr:ATP-binding protein [Treponema sp.]